MTPVRKSLLLSLLFTLCLSAPSLLAQATLAALRGTVTDPDSAVIPGATVTVTPRSGNASIVTTQADGTYAVTGLRPGLYSLTVTRAGFATYVQQVVRLAAGQQLVIDPRMGIEQQSQQVQVNADTSQVGVDPDSNASATVIKDKDLDALSDDPDELSNELTALAGPAVGPSGGQIYVDGFTGGQLPPKSSIREVRVNQNPFSAQYDKIGFGRVEVFTKPGTDKLHGSYSVQGGERALNTSNPFIGSKDQQPSYYTLFMIGSVTGPLSKQASFSVGGMHRTIQDNSIVNPTVFYSRTADPTDPCLPGPDNSAGCQIVPSGYPAAARAVFHPQTRSNISPRFDFQLGQNNTLTARYQYYVNGQQNAGVGNTNLPSVGYSTEATENTIQLSDTQIFGPRIINETRFEYERDTSSQTPNSTAPTLSVQGQFTAGGSPQGTSSSSGDHIEVQNYTSIQLRKNFVRMGGRLRTTGETLTTNAGSNGTLSYADVNDYIAGNVNLFRQTIVNNATIHARLTDLGLYLEDDWKPRPNLTVTYGLRLETQNVINSAHDFTPRLQVSYGIPRHGGDPLTVVHAGFGVFYDRFALDDVLTTQQLNGTNQFELISQNPANCTPTNLSVCGSSTTSALAPTTYTLGRNTRSAYTEIGVFGIDQQIGKVASISVNYATNKGIHQYFSRAFRLQDAAGNLTGYSDQFQSGGFSQEQQLHINGSLRAKRLTLWGFYGLTFASSNTGGSDTFATNPYNSRVDFGRAAYEQRNFAVAGGSWQLPHNVSLSPFLLAQSGTFYDVTSGLDTNQDGQINDRPYYTGSGRSCVDIADYSTVNTGNLTPVPINSCTGPANFTLNLRANKTFGFGSKLEASNGGGGDGGGRGGHGGGGPRGGGPGGGGPGGGGPGGGRGGSGSNTGRRYNFTIGAQAFNLFNAVPYGTPNSIINSGFGRFTTLAGGPFSTSTAVRRVTLQASFTF